MSYAIFIDSTADLPASIVEELGFSYMPYIFTLDGKEYYNYLDWRELSAKDFYNKLRGGKMSTTTQVTAARYIEAWEVALKEGKDVLYMCLSSKLSKSFEQSQLAAREAMEAYPGRKVITIDSKSACMGQGILAINAAKWQKEGKSLEENAAALEEMVPRLQHWFMPDDLHHLRRGGRVSGLQATLGTLLNVKPILIVTPEGSIKPFAKVRGRAKAIECFLEQLEKSGVDYTNNAIYIAHSDKLDLAEEIKQAIMDRFGAKDFVVNYIGPVIGSHTGPGTVALLHVGNTTRPSV